VRHIWQILKAGCQLSEELSAHEDGVTADAALLLGQVREGGSVRPDLAGLHGPAE
jgi:hypothetical protein